MSSGSIHTRASEPSLADLGAHVRSQNPNRGIAIPDALSRSDINRTTESVSVIGDQLSDSRQRHTEPPI